MQRNTIILIILLVLVIGGVFVFRNTRTSNQQESMNPTVTQMPSNGEEVYTGDLPCADCEGIDAVLTLRQNGTYTSSNTYRGRDVEPYVENGTWKMITGDATDPNAEVYELSPDNPNATKQYYRVSGNELQQLDTDLNPIEAPFNTSLTKQSE